MCLVRPILNLAWNNITYGVYVLANCSECCVMLSRGHYLAIYETLLGIIFNTLELVCREGYNI